MQSDQVPNESRLGPGTSSHNDEFKNERSIFLKQLLQAHPLNGQTTLHTAAFLGQHDVVDMLLEHGAPKESRLYLQTGDGLGRREREFFFGDRARDSILFGVSSLPAQAAAYQAAIRASPLNLEAYLRLAAVQARIEARDANRVGGEGKPAAAGSSTSADTWRQAWMLETTDDNTGDDDEKDENTYVNSKRSAALAGVDDSGHIMSVPALTLEDISVRIDEPLAQLRALSLWRRQGVVVFPALIPLQIVNQLAVQVRAAVAPPSILLQSENGTSLPARPIAGDRSANIRNPDFRTLRGMHVRDSSAGLETIASMLAPFLREALQDSKLIVLEHAAYSVGGGATEQAFHRDDSVIDSRAISIQVYEPIIHGMGPLLTALGAW